MALHEFNYDGFIAVFPEWSAMSSAQITPFWNVAKNFVYAYDNQILEGDTLQFALDLMCAHIMQIKKNTTDALSSPSAGGESSSGATSAGGVLTSAGEGSVNISYAPPTSRSAWQYWLNQTPYGQQFLALFSSLILGGFYIGGLPESQAYRKVGGVWK